MVLNKAIMTKAINLFSSEGLSGREANGYADDVSSSTLDSSSDQEGSSASETE